MGGVCAFLFAAVVLFSVAVAVARRVNASADQKRDVGRASDYQHRQRLVGLDSEHTVDIVGEFYNRYDCGVVADKMTSDDAVACLEREPNNPHDSAAVKVVIFGRHVGYLAKMQARSYRPAIDLAAAHGELIAARVTRELYNEMVDGEMTALHEFALYLPTPKQVMRELEAAYA